MAALWDMEEGEVDTLMAEGEDSEQSRLLQLPNECISQIALLLSARDVVALSSTCTVAYEYLSSDNLLWKAIVLRELGQGVEYADICKAACAAVGIEFQFNRKVRMAPRSWKAVCRTYHLNAQSYLIESRYPVHRAIEDKNTLAALYLLNRAQDLGLSVDERDMDGISVLDTAASMGDTTLTRVLCQRGLAYAAESAPDGWSPLMKACSNGDAAMARTLLELGADRTIDAQTSHYKWTALHYACKGGQIECVKVLLEYGASKFRCDFGGRVPLALWGTSMRQRSCGAQSAEEARVQSMLR